MLNWISNTDFIPEVVDISFDLGDVVAKEKALKISEELVLQVVGDEASLLKVNADNEYVDTVLELNGDIFKTIDLDVLPNMTMIEFFKLASQKEDNRGI